MKAVKANELKSSSNEPEMTGEKNNERYERFESFGNEEAIKIASVETKNKKNVN